MLHTRSFKILRFLGSVATMAAALSGCSSTPQPLVSGIDETADLEPGETTVQKAAPSATPELAEDVVLAAGRPFSGFRPADGARFDEEELFTYLASADAVCIGERHDAALDHYAQWRTLGGFFERRPMRGFELGIGLEMVPRERQLALTEYLSGATDRERFLSATDWGNTWGFPIQFYDPALVLAKTNQVRGVALGVPRRVTRRIVERGLHAISASDRRLIPDLDLGDPVHRKLFDSLMQGHPLPDGMVLDHFYQAQVVWDEAMALVAKNWLMEHHPLRKLLIFAGAAHCHRNAIPARMERGTELVVVNLITTNNQPHRPTGESTDDLLYRGYEYQIVFDE